jgi:enamine deaminase RidA (YjgF/YER057c/UK114 family)
MTASLTRRAALLGIAAPVLSATSAAAGANDGPRQAADVNPGEQAMTDIQRFEFTPAIPGIPLISWAVARGNVVQVSGISGNPDGDVVQQTRQVLARIDQLLAKAGTEKSRLLSAVVWLTDMSLFAAHNNAWNEWVDPKNPPARACLLSPQLWRPGLLVEIMATAAR